MPKFKQRCMRCRKNWVILMKATPFVVCYDCQKKELEGEIKDPAMKYLFSIPEEMYQNSAFLRNIKSSYLKFGRLSEKQIEAFRKTVGKMNAKDKAEPSQ